VSEPYNRFSGRSLERLTALTDGVFAVAMTLLVLDLRVPDLLGSPAHPERSLWDALLSQGPSFAAYLLSFTMLGTFWLAQHGLLGILRRCDRTLTWIQLGFLFVVTLLPFSAALLARYDYLRVAVGVYWLNLLLLGAALEWSSRYGRSALLPEADADGGDGDGEGGGEAAERLAIFRHRILVAQVLYAAAAAICFIDTVASIVALIVVQLYFIVSPRRLRIESLRSRRDDG
jgi:uncharacterized membrane protein